jgi:plastocyanin
MRNHSILPVLLLPALVLASIALACGDDDDDAPPAATSAASSRASGQGEDAKITVADNKFEPASATIKVNHEAIWEWTGSNPHQVVGTFDGQRVESPRLTGGGTFIFSFPKAGTFSYECSIHGASMSGKITVEQ